MSNNFAHTHTYSHVPRISAYAYIFFMVASVSLFGHTIIQLSMVHNMLGVSWLFCPWNLMRWIWEMQRVQGSCLGNKQLFQSPWLYHSHLPKPAFSSRPDPLNLVTDYCTVYWIWDCSIILEAKMILSLCSWLSPPYEEMAKLVNQCCKEHDICKFKSHIGREIAYKRTFIKKKISQKYLILLKKLNQLLYMQH